MRCAGSILFVAIVLAGPVAAAGQADRDWLCRVAPATDVPITGFTLKADRQTLCVGGDCRVVTAPDPTHRRFQCGRSQPDRGCPSNARFQSTAGPFIYEAHIVIDLAARTFEGEASGRVGDIISRPYDRTFQGTCEPAS